MFLKEILSIFSFSSSIFMASGFALKIDKFENNQIFIDNLTKELKILLSYQSYKKLNLNIGADFNYFSLEVPKYKRVKQINLKNQYVEIIFDDLRRTENTLSVELIKYFLESKPLWINLFS